MIRDHLQENENVKPNTAFLEELKNKMPEFFNDEGFDIEKFQNALKENDVNEFSEGYQLNFIGKDYARKQAGDAPTSVIVPDNEHNQKEENKNSKNLFFTGDNLEVLRHLRNNYSNKIDVIYIDPPYNTGNDDFVYPDKFEYSDKQLEEVFGMSDKDVSKLNALKGSKSHSAWLTFMYPRLWLAKQLLTDDGVIFISIDDNEQANLKELMDDIYGESNFIDVFINRSNPRGNQAKKNTASEHDYVICYSKQILCIDPLGQYKNREEFNQKDGNGYYTEIGLRKRGAGSLKEDAPNQYYPIYYSINDDKISTKNKNKNDILIWPKLSNGQDGRWRWSKDKVEKNKKSLLVRLVHRRDGSKKFDVFEKKYFTGKEIKKIKSIFYDKKVNNECGTEEVKKLFSEMKLFSYPKPTFMIKLLISSIRKKDSLILDFFAGSSTTADAVMQLNAEDGGKRKFIMVQLPEKTYKVDKNGNKKPTKGGKAAFDAGYMSIDEISRERIKRAAKKIKDENPDLDENFDGGFKHYRVVSPQKETLDKIYDFDPERYELVSDMIDSFSSSALGVPGNASGEDTILTTWLAEDGYDFNTDDLVEYDFAGYKALGIKDTRLYLIDGNLHSEQIKELLNQLGTNKVKFQSIVVYGYSFNVMDMKELERGLSQLNSKVNLIKRY